MSFSSVLDIPGLPEEIPGYKSIATISRFHTNWISALAFSPDGEWLATAGADGVVFFFNIPDQRPVLCLSFTHPLFATSLLWSSTHDILIGRSDGVLQIFQVVGMEIVLVHTLQHHSRLPISHVCYNSDVQSPQLAIAFECTVILYEQVTTSWGRPTWRVIDTFTSCSDDGGIVTSIHFLEDSKYRLMVTHAQAGFTYWESQGLFRRQPYQSIGNAHILANKSIVALTLSGTLDVFNSVSQIPKLVADRQFLAQDDGYSEEPNCPLPVCSMQNGLVLIGSTSGWVEIVNIVTAERAIMTHPGHSVVRVLATHGNMFASGAGGPGQDSIIRVFAVDRPGWPKGNLEHSRIRVFNIRSLHRCHVMAKYIMKLAFLLVPGFLCTVIVIVLLFPMGNQVAAVHDRLKGVFGGTITVPEYLVARNFL